ncbi:formate dehydrogenase subunit alpha, partial [Candidatus Heimdallarchaeota archaeon]
MSTREKIKITIDGKEVEGYSDETYHTIAKKNGIEIPTICHHPELKPAGKCRVCVVEQEIGGVSKIIASCKEIAVHNSIIRTDSERIVKTRTALIKKMVKSHSEECSVCGTGQSCKVKSLEEKYLIDEPVEKEAVEPDIRENNEFFTFDASLCVKCGICVRVTQELQVCNVLNMERGKFDGFPFPNDELSFESSGCVACGNCVAACPSGALSSHHMKQAEYCEELTKTTTVCSYCGVGCNFDILANQDTNTISYVDSNLSNVVNGLALCVKGRFGWDFVNHPERLNAPLIKKNGEFVEASWDEAFDFIEKKLKTIRSESGPGALAFLTSAKCTNEENYLMQKFARAAIGTNNVDHCARLCHASTVAGLARAFGSGAMTNSIDDLTNDAEVIVIIGSNTTEAHPVIGMKIKQAVISEKTKLIVADPRKIELVDYSEIHLQHKPGSDVALINAFMKVILDENLHDEEFIKARTEG